MATLPEVVQARRRRPFTWELRCANLQLRRRFSSLAGYYGDYSLRRFGQIHLDEIQHQRLVAVCDLNQPRRSALRAGAFEPCEQLANVVRHAHRHHSQTFMRPSGRYFAILLGRRKAKWSRCSPRISVSLPHLHAVARLAVTSPSRRAISSGLGDQVLKRLQSPTPLSATSFVDSNCGYPDHRIVRWPRSAAERYNHE